MNKLKLDLVRTLRVEVRVDFLFIEQKHQEFCFRMLAHVFASAKQLPPLFLEASLLFLFFLLLLSGPCKELSLVYATTFVITPAPTVLPPSRIANLCLSSSATGATNLTWKVTVSPGITISTPAARVTSPVTSVVLM